MKKSNKDLTIKVNNDLTAIHIKIDEILPIDDAVRNCLGKHTSYRGQDLLQLNMKLFLDYSIFLLNKIKDFLKSLKWIKTKEYWKDFYEYEKVFKELNRNVKIDEIQIKGANELFNGLIDLRDDLSAGLQDFELERREKFMRYYGSFVGAFTTVYFSLSYAYNAINIVGIFIYLYILLFGFVGFYFLFYPERFHR
ncbi:MAG: hypothetical protein M1559_01590 [Candidatus Marsarchaeota archaeon]|jgi:hypothetical protein|nr:hypothetical protein [Candidatus Marsarchaeota archaeon]